MQSYYCNKLLCGLLAICLLNIASIICSEFNPNYVGTTLQPCAEYFFSREPTQFDNITDSETFARIKEMLTVISTKFTKLVIADKFISKDIDNQYIHNSTYYDRSHWAAIYSGQAAAWLNREQESKRLELIYTVSRSKNTEEGLREAMRSAIKANKIFPGTVMGICLDNLTNLQLMQETLRHFRALKEAAALHDLKLGVQLDCLKFLDESNDTLYTIQQDIVKLSEFIFCEILPSNNSAQIGVAAGLQTISDYLLAERAFIRHLNPRIDVFGITQWSSGGIEDWETESNLVEYWTRVGEWAQENSCIMYLVEAIDNPCLLNESSLGHLGWWTLKHASNVKITGEYVEKVSEPQKELKPTKNILPEMSANKTIKVVSKCCQLTTVNKNLVGVGFYPPVMYYEIGQPYPTALSYTLENIKTMLSVVSGKFSRVMVHHTKYLFHGRYIYNFTYYHGSYPSVLSAEAAAIVNRERGNKSLTLIYSTYIYEDILLAFEAAEKANTIFPGTLDGIYVRAEYDLSLMKRTLNYLKSFKIRASNLGIKLGVNLYCDKLTQEQNATFKEIYSLIINKSDFVICGTRPPNDEHDALGGANRTAKELLFFREYLRAVNPNVETIGYTEWYEDILDEWNTVHNLKIYWETVASWAHNYNLKVYIAEAFETPTEVDIAHGWWRLTNNANINELDGYIEKISELPERFFSTNLANAVSETTVISKAFHNEDELWNWTTISLCIIGGAIAVCLSSLVFFLSFLKRQSKGLTAADIRDFIFGSRNEETNESTLSVLNCILGNPYDKSLEIPKNTLRVDKNKLLGSGQFGFVYKGIIDTGDGDVVEVAVKVPKNNCPSAALKGILSEIKIMSFLGQHANIAVLRGAYTAELARGVVQMAIEFCSLGSLKEFLRKKQSMEENGRAEENNRIEGDCLGDTEPTNVVTPHNNHVSEMIRWTCEIACGMGHLEAKRVVHADLAARNVLLTSDKTAKIADFGLSRRMYSYQDYVKKSKDPLPWRWMAVESLKKLEFSSKSDVWSYGVTVWEIFSMGDTPFPGATCNEDFVDALVNGLRPKTLSSAPPEISQLMHRCWNLERKLRPTFTEIVNYATALLQNGHKL